MKKLTVLFVFIICFALILSSCENTVKQPEPDDNNITDIESDETDNSVSVINVGALKGPTAMGLVKLMDDETENASGNVAYDFVIEAAPDAISPKLIKGELDIAAIPANLASVLYNNTDGQIVVVNINTLGVLYIVENGNSVNSVEDLRGKTIYTSGKGSTPEYALNYMLESNGLVIGTDVNIEFKAEHAECVAAIVSDESGNSVAMLPQPFVTTAQMSNENIRIALDLSEEWKNASGKTLITGVMVARKQFAEEHSEELDAFLKKYNDSVAYVNQNTEDAAALIEKFDIFKAAVAKKALPFCNIVFIDGADMKEALGEYLNELYSQNPASVGGKLPADDFYYNAEQ